MNAIVPIVPDDITAKKILITMFNMSAPVLTAGELIALHGEGAYPLFAKQLARTFRGNREINDIWSETLKGMFGALTNGMGDAHPMIKGINVGLTRRDEQAMNDALQEAEFKAACKVLDIALEPVRDLQ